MSAETRLDYKKPFLHSKNSAYSLNPEDYISQLQGNSSANEDVTVKYNDTPACVIVELSDWVFGRQRLSRNRYVDELCPKRFGEQTGELDTEIVSGSQTFMLFSAIFKAEEANERESLSPESSLTTMDTQSRITVNEIKALFAAARYEVFEEGMDSHFSRCLTSMIEQYGNKAVEVSLDLSVQSGTNSEVAYETMRLFGRIDHPATYKERMNALIRGLRHSVPRVRDGAALGLASLDDPQAIYALREAIAREQCQELWEDMKQVLEQLECNC